MVCSSAEKQGEIGETKEDSALIDQISFAATHSAVRPQEMYLRPGIDTINLRLAPNPSHLEAINPVVLGFCRAQQVPCEAEAERDGITGGKQRQRRETQRKEQIETTGTWRLSTVKGPNMQDTRATR